MFQDDNSAYDLNDISQLFASHFSSAYSKNNVFDDTLNINLHDLNINSM